MADIVGWDVRTWSQAVDCWERALAGYGGERSGPMRPLDVLEVGAGPAGPSLWLALKGHRVVTSNLGDTAALARPLHERYGVADRVEYRDLDLLAGLPYREAFDVVVFKSVLGGFGDPDPALPAVALAAIRAALKPGGLLLWAENLRGTAVHRFARWFAYRVRHARTWHYLTSTRLRALLAADFVDVDFHAAGTLAVLGTNERARERLAVLDRSVLDRLQPAPWHYMAYGTARRPG